MRGEVDPLCQLIQLQQDQVLKKYNLKKELQQLRQNFL